MGIDLEGNEITITLLWDQPTPSAGIAKHRAYNARSLPQREDLGPGEKTRGPTAPEPQRRKNGSRAFLLSLS